MGGLKPDDKFAPIIGHQSASNTQLNNANIYTVVYTTYYLCPYLLLV